MTEHAEPEVGTGLDAPVTNKIELPEEATLVSPEPSPGAEGEYQEVRDGAEAVEGFRKTEIRVPEFAAAAAETTHLRDIGEASFGPPAPVPETVHGLDDRVRITSGLTRRYPWRVHASLRITAADNSQWIGTGWFVSPRTLITAGHVVYIKGSGIPGRDGWVKSMQVMPGRDGGDTPFGSVTATEFHSVVGWTQNGDEEYDYGAIVLPSDLGNQVGWIAFGVFDDAELLASVGNISGYPGDKPPGTQWYDARQIASVASRKVFYDIDTFGGQSGSATYRIVDGVRYAVAIHAYGGATVNSGTRINVPVFNNLMAWRA